MVANETQDKILSDLKQVVEESEELLADSAGVVGEKGRAFREQLSRKLDAARATYRRLEEKTKEGAQATDKLIREHPYQTLGVALGVGIVLGFLLKRK